MAVPKRKTSTTRRDKRRTNWKLKVPQITKDAFGTYTRSHRIGKDGFYRGVQIRKPEDE